MPPRRRGKATTSRAAAIQAVQRKRRAQLQQHDGGEEEEDDDNHHHHHQHSRFNSHLNSVKDGNHHHNHSHSHNHHHSHNHNHLHQGGSSNKPSRIINKQLGKKRSHNEDDEEEDEEEDFSSNDDEEDEEEDDDDCPPPLVGNDEEFCDGDGGEVDDDDEEEEEDDEEEDDEEDDDDDDAVVGSTGSSNTMSGEGGCLHCHKSATASDIQVRCDECQAYICQNCHWCHEFQANHEIRVCDRCDAFYCRTCDEMDQCDDCGEVVCASCSTLLSCKFCGGGLCEECATACGRCGIVLCSRDAKFAVDCDTCRLSYCLVCLASGSKDPCVRCGHRPSKRMEQLVHLRLKSIYKAFKQSSRNSKYGGDGGDDDDEDDEDDDDEDDDDDDGKAGDPQSLLQAAASAASKHSSGGRPNASRHNHHHPSSHHPTTTTTTTTTKRTTGSTSAAVSRDQQAKDMVDKYMAEKEKADAAAAALLAELDEEEDKMKSKKNKKKRKKERLQAKKEEDTKPTPEEETQQDQQSDGGLEEDDDSDIEIIDIAKATTKNKSGKEGKKKKKKKSQANKSNDENDAKNIAGETATSTEPENKSDIAAKDDPVSEGVPATDPVEQQLCEYVADSDMNGIEDILHSLKGVPGRAQLRKNAKKALKKLKAEQEAVEEAEAAQEAERMAQLREEEAKKQTIGKVVSQQVRSSSGAGTPATHSETNSSATGAVSHRPPPPPPLPPNELFRLVSLTHNKPVNAATASHVQRVAKGQTMAAAPAVRSECVMHIAYNVVGWVIGKGGQRIRDLMEESGAKVWIDQEHLSEKDPRIVYVSGNRKNVESAVKLVKELVNKAPVPGGGPVGETEPSHPNVGNTLETGMKNLSFGAALKAAGADQPLAQAHRVPPAKTGESLARVVSGRHSGDHAHEITCEACFVPLLIGRRGWTIKHIQDSSGARVDIDQTVTPRKIKISGDKDNVETAIRMVRDVLSYPHAQLQGAAESLEDLEHPEESQPKDTKPHPLSAPSNLDPIAPTPTPPMPPAPVGSGQPESNVATLSNTTTVGASNQVVGVGPNTNSQPELIARAADERVHTPPPSSHINIGDAKSTISASSSLSSTPEPSMASTSKGHFGSAGAAGPLIPPEFGGSYGQSQPNVNSSNVFAQQNNLPQLNLSNITDAHGGASGAGLPNQQHVSPPLFPSGLPGSTMPSVSPRYDMQSGPQRGFPPHPHHQQQQRQHDNQQNMLMGQSMMREHQHLPPGVRAMNGIGGMPQHGAPPHYRSRPDAHAFLGTSSMQYPAGMPNQQRPLHMHQQSAFHVSDQKQIRHNPPPEMGMGSRYHPAFDAGAGNVVDPRGKPGPGNYMPPPGGMWGNGRNGPYPPGADGANARLARHSSVPEAYQQHNNIPMPGRQPRSSSTAALPVSLGLGVLPPLDSKERILMNQDPGVPPPAAKPIGKAESLMVDSLFGPSDSGNVEKDILPGFQGLTLGSDGLGSDMWTKDLSQDWDPAAKSSSSALFAAIQPNLGANASETQHPSQSRFGWGANNESQGQSS